MFITWVKSHIRTKTDSWVRGGRDGQAEHRGFEGSENTLYYIIMKDTSHSSPNSWKVLYQQWTLR